MRRSKKLFLWLLAAGLFGFGCAEATCEKICDACNFGDEAEKDCRGDCKEEYNDGDSDCKSAMRDLSDCVDDNGCRNRACYDDFVNLYDECDIDFKF